MRRLLDQDSNVALELRDAFAYEARSIGKALGTDPRLIETEIASALGVTDTSSVRGGKEKDALGGNMREAMRDEPSPSKRYVGSVTWASQMSHGTVLALREVSKATDGRTDDFFEAATSDSLGNVLLYHGLWTILHFMVRLDEVFETGYPADAEMDKISIREQAINVRLQIVSPEQEARGKADVEEHARRMRSKAHP